MRYLNRREQAEYCRERGLKITTSQLTKLASYRWPRISTLGKPSCEHARKIECVDRREAHLTAPINLRRRNEGLVLPP